MFILYLFAVPLLLPCSDIQGACFVFAQLCVWLFFVRMWVSVSLRVVYILYLSAGSTPALLSGSIVLIRAIVIFVRLDVDVVFIMCCFHSICACRAIPALPSG